MVKRSVLLGVPLAFSVSFPFPVPMSLIRALVLPAAVAMPLRVGMPLRHPTTNIRVQADDRLRGDLCACDKEEDDG